jgi:hypothetical protein
MIGKVKHPKRIKTPDAAFSDKSGIGHTVRPGFRYWNNFSFIHSLGLMQFGPGEWFWKAVYGAFAVSLVVGKFVWFIGKGLWKVVCPVIRVPFNRIAVPVYLWCEKRCGMQIRALVSVFVEKVAVPMYLIGCWVIWISFKALRARIWVVSQ